MLKKLALVTCSYFVMVALILIVTGHMLDATTALYNATFRLVNDSGFVTNGIASATTASYNATARVVDQNGTVLNPGSASTTVATPNLTIRIVDSNNFVQSALGSTPAPTATPTPSVSLSAHCGAVGVNPSCTLTGAAPGDTVVANEVTSASINNPLNFAPALIAAAFTGGVQNVYYHVITPQEGTSPTITITDSNTTACLALAAFRGQMPSSTDPIGTAKAIASSTTYTFNAFTTIKNDTIALAMTGYGGGPNSVSAEPAGYAAAQETSATAPTFGCSIAWKVKATAGAETPGNATLASAGAGDTFGMGLFLQN